RVLKTSAGIPQLPPVELRDRGQHRRADRDRAQRAQEPDGKEQAAGKLRQPSEERPKGGRPISDRPEERAGAAQPVPPKQTEELLRSMPGNEQAYRQSKNHQCNIHPVSPPHVSTLLKADCKSSRSLTFRKGTPFASSCQVASFLLV